MARILDRLINGKRRSWGSAALRLAYAFTAGVYLVNLPASAAEMGNRDMGARLAAEVCAECHAITAGDFDSPNLDAPAFQIVADRPATTALSLGVWFRSPHPTMPNFVLTPDETSNLIAYIFSLREEGGSQQQ